LNETKFAVGLKQMYVGQKQKRCASHPTQNDFCRTMSLNSRGKCTDLD
jgi:hypothetical protein